MSLAAGVVAESKLVASIRWSEVTCATVTREPAMPLSAPRVAVAIEASATSFVSFICDAVDSAALEVSIAAEAKARGTTSNPYVDLVAPPSGESSASRSDLPLDSRFADFYRSLLSVTANMSVLSPYLPLPSRTLRMGISFFLSAYAVWSFIVAVYGLVIYYRTDADAAAYLDAAAAYLARLSGSLGARLAAAMATLPPGVQSTLRSLAASTTAHLIVAWDWVDNMLNAALLLRIFELWGAMLVVVAAVRGALPCCRASSASPGMFSALISSAIAAKDGALKCWRGCGGVPAMLARQAAELRAALSKRFAKTAGAPIRPPPPPLAPNARMAPPVRLIPMSGESGAAVSSSEAATSDAERTAGKERPRAAVGSARQLRRREGSASMQLPL